MLTSKQRAKLRGIANNYSTILQIGKADISEETVVQINDALTARELIKIRVLKNSTLSAATAANELSEKTNSEIVQVIGDCLILFRRNTKKPKIEF